VRRCFYFWSLAFCWDWFHHQSAKMILAPASPERGGLRSRIHHCFTFKVHSGSVSTFRMLPHQTSTTNQRETLGPASSERGGLRARMNYCFSFGVWVLLGLSSLRILCSQLLLPVKGQHDPQTHKMSPPAITATQQACRGVDFLHARIEYTERRASIL
jgi:hypothetical protein